LAAVERSFPPDHPAAQGHFPGNPIIPGAVLLNEVLRSVGAALDADLSSCRVRHAKFFAPVRPGDRVVIEFSRTQAGDIRFACAVRGKTVMKGELACDTPAAAT